MARAPWVILQHVAHEGPGLIADALDGAGVPWTRCRVDLGEAVPAPTSVDELGGVVAMGGPMGVHDDAEHPWLADERRLLVSAAEAGRTVLGVCLGAQQLALALGAEVVTGERPEIGPGSITLTAAGRADRVLGSAGSPMPCVHWHGDTFSLPPDAVLLAGSDRYPNQAFRVGTSVYALQFHVEVDAALAAAWAGELPAGITISGEHLAAVERVGRPILDRLVGAP